MPRKKVVYTGDDLRRMRTETYGAGVREVARASLVAPSTVLRWESIAQLPRCPTGALRKILYVLRVRLCERRFPTGDKMGPHERLGLVEPASVPCGAKTRAGGPCKKPPVPGKRRCRLHGGLSTGPKTPEGRAKCANAARNRRTRAE